MTWPARVREDVLVASGRRCALCTVFAGVRLELHHIQPESKGGTSTFENCIPLCFNCHADVGHYDPTHPRGNRYNGSELQRHRDRLYVQVSEGRLLVEEPPPAPPQVNEVDRALFREIRDRLQTAVVGRFLQDHDFAGDFPVEPWGALNDYIERAEEPDFTFVEPELASLHRSFNSSVEQLLSTAFGKVWSSQREGWLGVPPEWTDPNHVRNKDFWPAAQALNSVAREASNGYKALIRDCRLRLDVP